MQSTVIPVARAGRDVLVKSPTGSGKTLAFLLPIVDSTRPGDPTPSALILAPTRELAAQILEDAAPLVSAVGLRAAAVVGGVPIEAQARAAAGAQLIVATPGRLIDLLERRRARLVGVRTLVLDEADRMLDMGFRPQTERIIAALPRERQTMLFSATLDGQVGDLARVATTDAARVDAPPPLREDGEVAHRFVAVDGTGRVEALLDVLGADAGRGRTLVFSRTRHGAKRLRRRLEARGVTAGALHGDMTQAGRTRALADFDAGRVSVLVATDVAARGIDVAHVTHVVHFDAPGTREDFVHRSGRTGRAGRAGVCVTLVAPDEEADVSRIAVACGLEAEYRRAGLRVAAPRVVRVPGRARRPAPAPRPRPVPAAASASPPRNRVPRRSRAAG